jgi:hypothetical protein
VVLVMVVIAVLVTTWALLGTAVAQKTAVPKPQDKLVIGEDEVKQLLLLIDTNKTGKITKQEWMKFMEAEFEIAVNPVDPLEVEFVKPGSFANSFLPHVFWGSQMVPSN